MASEGHVPLTSSDLKDIYSWIDAVPSSRQKKNIARDFSDGVMVAKIVQFYLPKMVELQMHNYVSSNSTPQKRINWDILSKKIFAKLNLKFEDYLVESVLEAKPGAVEQILFQLKRKVMELSPLGMSPSTLATQVQATGQQKSVFRKSKSQRAVREPSRPVTAPAAASVGNFPAAPAATSAFPAAAPTPPAKSGFPPKQPSTRSNSKVKAKVQTFRNVPYKPNAAGKVQQFQPKREVQPEVIQPSAPLTDEEEEEDEEDEEQTPYSVPEAQEPPQNYYQREDSYTTYFPEPVPDHNANQTEELEDLEFPPDELSYRGHLMVPAVHLEKKSQQVRDMEQIVSTLTRKVNFLDKLITQKDVRLEGMARELQRIQPASPTVLD